ncbi:MAG TPA: sortase, partial [Aggregatilineaceae bacterium]|nr:sortase [Aggregatilineaceae bacterium]
PVPTVEGTKFPVMMQFPATATPYSSPTPAGERYLLIPKLSAQFQAPIPIVNLPIVERHWDVTGLGYYVGWLEGTNWLEPSWGNTVLVAHVQLGFHNPGPFWGLGDLVPGDEIVVIEGGSQVRYVVTSTQKVDPEDWTVTAPTTSPILTLITCTEWDRAGGVFSQRMVVQAVPAQS